MNNQDPQLKLQALLDGELPESETAGVRDWLARDEAAQALFAELRSTKSALAGNEAERKLPESREFFWSKVQREIEREERATAAPAARVSWLAWLRGHLMPVTGAAFLACVAGIMLFQSGSASQFGEMEVASDDMGAYTFRDQQAQLTTIWFYDRSDDSQFTDNTSVGSVETE